MRHRILVICIGLLLHHAGAHAQIDTLRISDAYTTHLIFSSDVTYADLSNPADVVAKVIEQNRNMLAVKGREAFTSLTSLSALESNGRIHTFIVGYDGSPESLIRDMRENASSDGRQVSLNRSSDAPLLSNMVTMDQAILQLYRSGMITRETALDYADAPDLIRRQLN